jgi:hypothetical protein
MLTHKIGVAALVLSASVLAIETANANTASGTTWEVATSIAMNATLANVPASGPNATWSAPSDPLSFNSNADPVNGYTLGGFLATGGAFGVSYHGGALSTDTLDSTITEVTGTVSVTTGEKFTIGHDDGFSLAIGGWSFSDPGPTAFTPTTVTYTGASGNKSFELAYGECCGPPAVLLVDLPLNSIPEPSTWAMMGLGFAGLGFVGLRRARKTSVSIA